MKKKHEKKKEHPKKKESPAHEKRESPSYERREHKKKIASAMKHKDVLGAGAKKRKHLGSKDKVETVMKEFKRGTLHSGSGPKVTNRKQAIAIALSEAGKSKKKSKR